MQRVRTKYVHAFKQCLAARQATHPDVHPEIRVELSKASRYPLHRLMVVDAVQKNSDGTVTGIRFGTDPIEATHPLLEVLTPVCWQDLTFSCHPFGFPERRLRAWGNRWIHDESPPLGPQDGLTGIIHFVGEPVRAGHEIRFNVDLGSAPLVALEELLSLFGPRGLAVGSYGEPGTA